MWEAKEAIILLWSFLGAIVAFRVVGLNLIDRFKIWLQSTILFSSRSLICSIVGLGYVWETSGSYWIHVHFWAPKSGLTESRGLLGLILRKFPTLPDQASIEKSLCCSYLGVGVLLDRSVPIAEDFLTCIGDGGRGGHCGMDIYGGDLSFPIAAF